MCDNIKNGCEADYCVSDGLRENDPFCLHASITNQNITSTSSSHNQPYDNITSFCPFPMQKQKMMAVCLFAKNNIDKICQY